MPKNISLFLILIVFIGGRLQAEDYLLRVQPVCAANTVATKMKGTLEFSVIPERPFFVRSTLGEDSQIIFKGQLHKIDNSTFEIEYDSQITELRSDPNPRLTRKGKVKVDVYGKETPISKLSPEKDPAPLDFIISLKPLRSFGAMENTSGFAVRLVDASGKPVDDAHAGLYGPMSESPWECVIGGRTNQDGIIIFTEGREDLPTRIFYAEHKGRKLYAAENLNVDKIRAKDYKYFTITMTEQLTRWKKPEEDN